MESISVALDWFPLYTKSAGVKRYLHELGPRLSELDCLSVRPLGPTQRDNDMVSRILTMKKVGFGARQLGEAVIAPLSLRSSVDLLHFTDNYGPLVSAGIPYVITVHDATFITHKQYHESAPAKWLRFMQQRTWSGAARLIAISETTAKDLIELGYSEDHIAVVPHGIDHSIWGQDAVAGPFIEGEYIAYLGSIEPRKQVPLLVEAFKRLQTSDFPDLQLLIAGAHTGGPDPLALLTGTEGVHYLGRLPDSEVEGFLRNARCVVYPSVYEGFGLPPLEALACGTSAIVGDTPVARETLGDSALFFTPGRIEELISAMRSLLNGTTAKPDAEGVRELLSRYSWSKTAELTAEVYWEVLNESAS